MQAKAQIFLSYAREDEEKVDQLYQQLSAAGFKPWMDKRDILPGERWKSSIPRAIRQSDFFLACLSNKSVGKRGFLQREIRDALDLWQERLENDIYLIPVRLDECPVPESLCDFQWVDLFEQHGWTRLVKAIQAGMERRGETMQSPVQQSPQSESHLPHGEPSSGVDKTIAPCGIPWLLEAPSTTVLWPAQLGEPPTGPPMAVGGLLLVPTQEPGPSARRSTLCALNLADGSPRWKKPFEYAHVSGLVAIQTSKVSKTSEVLALVATASTDLMRDEGALLALDAAGEERWRWAPGVQRVSAPAVVRGDDFSRDMGATKDATTSSLMDIACVTADTRMLLALDLTTGDERTRVGLEASASLEAPAVVGGVAYVPCRGPHLLAVDLDGETRWRFDAEEYLNAWLDKTPIVVGEHLFAVLSTGVVLALWVEDGSLAWRVDVGPTGKRLSPPATDGEQLYVGAHDGLHTLDLADGHELWAFPTERRITAAPVVAGGVVYATCHDHHLYTLDAAIGRELWRYEAGRRIEVSPVVTTCGEPARPCILVADRGGTVTAVARPLSAEEHEAAGHWVEAAPAYAATERPVPAIPVSPAIRQLANLIRARREAGDQPYTLLLGSSLSLTPEVRQAVCGSDDWEAFWTAIQGLSAAERHALLAGPLDSLNLTAGYRCLAQLIQAGYFDLVLTLNVDDALDESLRILPAREYQIFTHGQVPGPEIAAALGRTHPRVKAVKLRGDINAYKLPLTPEGQFELPKELEEVVEWLLSQDTILVGDVSSDTDIQRCIRQGEGALWVVLPEEPRPGSFLYNGKKARPKGEVISGPEAEFVSFFSALARELGEMYG